MILFFSLFFQSDVKSETKNDYERQNESYSLKNQNDEILYDRFVSAGGPEIRVGEWYWGFCKIWVETIITKSYSNGYVRNNPDGSFYPGDGFGYVFVYGWVGDSSKCRNLTVCPITSKNIMPGNSQSCQIQKLKTLSKKASKNANVWSEFGIAEISADQNAFDHYIQLQVNAERWGCHFPKNAPRTCGWASISTAGTFSPTVIKPLLDVNLSQEYLNDSDGYRSGNLDRTYYLWDAINIVHNPIYQWKKERVGTLSVKVTKLHELELEKEFQCESTQCNHVLSLDGFEPWLRQYQYGSGSTVYNATKELDLRKHAIIYKIGLYNLGKLIHTSQNKTEQLVVVYEPVYQSYPYLILKDGHWWSWGNRHGVALQYKGSVGGGIDDTAEIHQNRRSKINSYKYFGYAFDPILPKALNQNFSWNKASQIDLKQNCADVVFDLGSFETNDNSAMFVKGGYGKITFSWPILKSMLEKRYINATIENTLQSKNFAGFALKNLTKYSYQYPDVKFSNPVKVLTYHSDGSRTDLPVSVRMVPDFAKGAQYTQDYTCQKVTHDTANAELASIVVDDMYGKENSENGTGYVNVKTHLTSTWFAPFYYLITKDILDLPLAEGYKALSPYEITITVGEKTRTINRIVNFLAPFVHVVNMDSDNLLNVTEDSGFVRIDSDEAFGEITKVVINDKILDSDCTNGCTTTIHHNQDLYIQAWNVWGGRASYFLEKPAVSPINYKINWDLVFVAIIVAVGGLILWRFISRALEYLGFRRLSS